MKLPNLKFPLSKNRKMKEPNVEYVTKEEAQAMIDRAITQHNRNASIISMFLGIIFLALFAEGFFRVIGMIPPFMGIDVSLIQTIIDNIKEEIANSLL